MSLIFVPFSLLLAQFMQDLTHFVGMVCYFLWIIRLAGEFLVVLLPSAVLHHLVGAGHPFLLTLSFFRLTELHFADKA